MNVKDVTIGEMVLGLLNGHWGEMTLEPTGWKKWSSVLPGLVSCKPPEVVVPMPRPEDVAPTAGRAVYLLYDWGDGHHPYLEGVFSSVEGLWAKSQKLMDGMAACEGVTILKPLSYEFTKGRHTYSYKYKSKHTSGLTISFYGYRVTVDSSDPPEL